MKKVKISQDTLYEYMKEHDLKLVRLAEESGFSGTTINLCFKHALYPNGNQREFSVKSLQRINEALQRIAEGLRSCTLSFGSERTYTNQLGNCYDPALVKPVKRIGEWVNLTSFTKRVLGWSQHKKEMVLVSPSSTLYGCISSEEVDRINAELLSIIGMLSSVEVVKV